jgi:hypothetical protein
MALTPAEQAALEKARADLALVNGGAAMKSVAHGSRRLETHAPDPAGLERTIEKLEAKAAGRRLRGALSFRIG